MIIIVAMCNFQLRAANKGLEMKKIILTTSLIFSTAIVAHDLPNIFEAGESIVASKVNENFTELKNEIKNLKSQIDSFNDDNELRIVGATEPLIFGGLGYTKGQNACSDKFSGSQMCTREDLHSATGVANLTPNSPYIFRNAEAPICNYYSTRDNTAVEIMMSDGDGNLGGFLTWGFSIHNDFFWGGEYIPLKDWIENNLTLTESNLDESESTENKYIKNTSSPSYTGWNIKACNTDLPALCCK